MTGLAIYSLLTLSLMFFKQIYSDEDDGIIRVIQTILVIPMIVFFIIYLFGGFLK